MQGINVTSQDFRKGVFSLASRVNINTRHFTPGYTWLIDLQRHTEWKTSFFQVSSVIFLLFSLEILSVGISATGFSSESRVKYLCVFKKFKTWFEEKTPLNCLDTIIEHWHGINCKENARLQIYFRKVDNLQAFEEKKMDL